MSLSIKIADPSLPNFLEYVKELITSTSIMNITWINSYKPETLCLTCLGVKYKNDGAMDQIDHISEMIYKGYGKCDSIVAWFMAIYSLAGIESEPLIVRRSDKEVHAQMKIFENGKVKILDPSVNLQKINREYCTICRSGNRRK